MQIKAQAPVSVLKGAKSVAFLKSVGPRRACQQQMSFMAPVQVVLTRHRSFHIGPIRRELTYPLDQGD